MKNFLLAILATFFCCSLSAGEVTIEDWKKGLGSWTFSLAKTKAPAGTITYNRKKECVDIKVPAELVFLKKTNIPIKGVTKLIVTITPQDLNFNWLEVGIIFQSTVTPWKTLTLQQVKKEVKAQTFEFKIDGDWQSDSEWNHMWIRLNSDKKTTVRVGQIKALKEE